VKRASLRTALFRFQFRHEGANLDLAANETGRADLLSLAPRVRFRILLVLEHAQGWRTIVPGKMNWATHVTTMSIFHASYVNNEVM
jgi:hypothetical protein